MRLKLTVSVPGEGSAATRLWTRTASLVAQHGGPLVGIALASALGIFATAGFQVAVSRGLGPRGFGLLTAFLAFINIAAIGSVALRNAVAVDVAEAASTASDPLESPPKGRRLDSAAIEALALGALFTVGLLALSPWLASSLQSSSVAPVLAAATVLPYFIFARALGLLQGARRARAVVWWSTGTQLVQLVLAVAVLAMGFGVVGVLIVYLFTIVGATAGSTYQTRRIASGTVRRPFSSTSAVVLLLTIAFAWLTSVDVILVRSGASEIASGAYSAGAVLVKTTLILPATLSLYFLPRFVSSRGNAALSRLGVNVTVGLTFLAGAAIFVALALFGRPIVAILFGAEYSQTARFLPWMALSWIPWAMTQAILVRITAFASRLGLLVLGLAVVTQWVGAKLVLPNIDDMILLNGLVGLATLGLLFAVHLRESPTAPNPAQDGV